MVDPTARIDPDVLAAALRDVEGVELDLSTEDGVKTGAKLVERLMSNTESAERLLDAVARHADVALSAERPFPETYGAAAQAEGNHPSIPSLDVPPIGSPEFEAFMAVPASADELGPENVPNGTMPTANPSELGFASEVAPPPPWGDVDVVLRGVQRLLEVRLRAPHTFKQRIQAALDVLMDRSVAREWDALAMPKARNRFVVQLKREKNLWLWDSIAAGDSLYVMVIADGNLTFKGRLPLSNPPAARQLLENVFSSEPMVGVRTLHALRIAMTGGASVPRSALDAVRDS